MLWGYNYFYQLGFVVVVVGLGDSCESPGVLLLTAAPGFILLKNK